MNQIRVAWSGFIGGPGVSTFYADGSSNPDLTRLRAFFNGITGVVMAGVTCTFPSSGDILDPKTGELTGNWSVGTPPAPVSMAGAGAACLTQGVQVKWGTNDVADGHAIRGRTFLVPTAAGNFGTDGLLAAAAVTTITTAASSIIAGTPQFVIWHRPKKGKKPVGGGPAPIEREGAWSAITTSTIPRLPVVLTSRRD